VNQEEKREARERELGIEG